MASSFWENAALMLGVLAPLVGVPLTVFTFYLKGLRDQQRSQAAELTSRLAIVEAAGQRWCDELSAVRRDYATKEEWLREGMWARSRVEQLTAALARAEVALEQLSTAPVTAERAALAVARLEQFLRHGDARPRRLRSRAQRAGTIDRGEGT